MTESPRNSAGAQQRRSLWRYVASHGLTKLGDALMNPKTTLGWLGASLGVPTWMLGLIVPLRESGSMLLQVLVAPLIDKAPQRKWVWSGGSVIQGAAVAGMAVAAMRLQGAQAGAALLLLLLLFALARSVCSLASKDVMGRVLPSNIRGSAGGWASMAAGMATMLVAAGLSRSGEWQQVGVIAWVLLASAVVWVVAAALFASIDEPRDAPQPIHRASWEKLRLLGEDQRLLRFVLIRSLMLCSALSAPYYVLLANRHQAGGAADWWWFVVLAGLAGVIGGPVWGAGANRSSRRVMALGSGVAALLGLVLVAILVTSPSWLGRPWLMPLMFLLLCLAHEGVRIGRKTWIINIAEGQQRRDYVAVSNSAMGMLLLLVGGCSAVLANLSVTATLLGLSVLGITGAALASTLPDAERDPAADA